MNRKHGETKQMIMEQAGQLFMEKGYNAVSVNDICKAASVSKGSLYHHFQSKEQLLLEVIEEDARQWQSKWVHLTQAEQSAKQQLYLLAEHYAEDFQNPLSTALEEFARSQVITEEILAKITSINEVTLQACRSIIMKGIEQKELQNISVEDAVLIVSSTLEGLGKIYYTNNKHENKRIYRQAVQILLDGLSTR
ncbi:TetR family transcriptional regulator [Paenibacillus montaniterrae]|uniref:TetR family transcriptional regulator n=1 Tax=Paenibacillus montaniterrae TaxID=429341 RepID=A0A919YQI0_9BACL|nr:TetR/AcrR family transcriptional regulator [Paenibacillus montaniterrae]GIP17442.1 TetR family transcriptional regulator [Paenibacillus montaniterrae]